ncbi:MAG: glycosyltransferase [Kiritimatiellae bacterium]|nr:glycosyltransferase [Kiritimatiellia bacterium]
MWLSGFAADMRAQTYRGWWEAVFVDDGDGGTDYSVLEDPRFRLVRRPHGGVSAARNTGIDAAQGDLLLFADPDDSILPGWMENLVAAADGVDLAWGGFIMRENGTDSRFSPPDPGAEYRGAAVKSRVWRAVFGYRLRDVFRYRTRERMWKGCGREFGTVWCRAFRRSAVGDLRFDESLSLNEDAMFLAAFALRAESMRIVDCADYVYAIRPGGASAIESGMRKTANKFALRDARLRLDPGKDFWRGSFLLSAAEVCREDGPAAAWRYLTGKPSR